MSKQRIYRGGLQWHEHLSPHAGPMLHDGYWRHYHDQGGMVAAEEDLSRQDYRVVADAILALYTTALEEGDESTLLDNDTRIDLLAALAELRHLRMQAARTPEGTTCGEEKQ